MYSEGMPYIGLALWLTSTPADIDGVHFNRYNL